VNKKYQLSPDDLRWHVDEDKLNFKSTAEVNPTEGIIGQPVAMEAMRFGVESDAPGQNIYVRGSSGTGRTSLVVSLLAELKPKARRRLDRCYVHNFLQPDRPRLITLPAGQGPVLRRYMKELAEFIENRLLDTLDSQPTKSRRDAIGEATQQEIQGITAPLEKELKKNDLALVRLQAGLITRTVIFPLVDGRPIPPEELAQLVKAGKLTKENLELLEEKIRQFAPRLQEVSDEANKAWQQGMRNMQKFIEEEARSTLREFTASLLAELPQEGVAEFIAEVIDDVIIAPGGRGGVHS
jgi:hypothetical protein